MANRPRLFRPFGQATREEQRRSFDRKRDEAEQRRWYKTAQWQKLKTAVHVRDGYTCQVTGILCVGTHPADDSPVADHRIEPKGNPALFWDIDNIRTVSKKYHDSERQRQQIAERGRRGGV